MSVILIMVDVITTVSTHKEAISVSVMKDMKLITMEQTVQVWYNFNFIECVHNNNRY